MHSRTYGRRWRAAPMSPVALLAVHPPPHALGELLARPRVGLLRGRGAGEIHHEGHGLPRRLQAVAQEDHLALLDLERGAACACDVRGFGPGQAVEHTLDDSRAGDRATEWIERR